MNRDGESSSPDLDALDRVLADAHGVRVREMRGDSTVLLEERDPIAVRALREALAVTALPGFVCMCWGDVALDFHDAAGRALTTVTLHHGYSLRWDGWPEDAVLADGVRSLEWLAVRGVSEPLREFRAAEQRQAENDRVTRLWVREIPEPLSRYAHLFLDTSKSGGGLAEPDLDEVHTRLVAAYPDAVERILALCTWYASGTGAYTGYPVHERIPGQFLDRETRTDFARAVERADTRAAAGAVRYLVNWNTRKRVGALLTALSPTARRKILDHARDQETRRWLARRITGLH
ncbi:hypothetical protein [Nocardia huaxiensis]|uniref:Uncharacterized protein n=1 Tax=Nocardia huaxiensis TaxID=2755382 RepID=A0A7D7A021_9NOCA|nr:hypothetical protein [Nocardia huaxiensis]QLY32649.1 hypothetical protein H0264_10665 [Nocardia huaxiensis]UFS93618.1 hypothetical protein LPY97_22710 [Nocardia huaxiensis]